MLTGEQIRAARERSGKTQAEMARAVGTTQRSWGSWERGEGTPRNKMSLVEEVLRPYLEVPPLEGPALKSASDAQLLAEIARRFEKGRGDGRPPITDAGDDDPATEVQFSVEEDSTVRIDEGPHSPHTGGRSEDPPAVP